MISPSDQAKSNIVEVMNRFGIELIPNGSEFKCLCPFHSEETPSFTVTPSKGLFYCFGCGAAGSAVDFVMLMDKVDAKEAISHINKVIPFNPKNTTVKTKEVLEIIYPIPAAAPPPPNKIRLKIKEEFQEFISQFRWTYKDEKGNALFYVHRFDTPDGKVLTSQVFTKDKGWRFKWDQNSRPLYGLELLRGRPDDTVLIVEGEKTADAARVIFPELVVVTWSGGGNAAKKTNWEPLSGRNIILWPDADQKTIKGTDTPLTFIEQPGVKAMLDVARLSNQSNILGIIIPPEGVHDGWDLADAIPDGFDPKEAIKNPQKIKSLSGGPDDTNKKTSELPFTILGYEDSTIYAYQHARGKVDVFKRSEISINCFASLAPIDWWRYMFPNSGGGINRDDAANWMFRIAEQRGIYDPDRIRGRGAWLDDRRIIFHYGDRMMINGEYILPMEFKSKYVYETRKPFPSTNVPAIDTDLINRIFDITNSFRWANPASAILLLGWIVMSPICGSLRWRPHIWLSGGAGSGKSTILEEFIYPLLDGVTLYAQGNSTEAGVRQKLAGDALPIIFDETESNTEKDSLRIQNVLSLIRQTSSTTKAQVFKGTPAGSAMSYHIQSMFCLSSIQTSLIEQADRERITVLSLQSKKSGSDAIDNWRELSIKLDALRYTPDLSNRFLKFIIDNISLMLSNAETFSSVAADKFVLQREGNQYGTLFAGAYSLLLGRLIDKKEAREILDKFDFDEYRENSNNDDGVQILTKILTTQIRSQNSQYFLRDLILSLSGLRLDGIIFQERELSRLLANYGIKVKGDLVFFCNNHPKLIALFPNIPDLKAMLLRCPKAQKHVVNERFGNLVSKCVSIPLSEVNYDDK